MSDVTVVELGPRDGLQNESVTLTTAQRVGLVRALAATGLRRIEAGAFVHPTRVPQMAGSDDVCRFSLHDDVVRERGVQLSALVPNTKGLERARAAGLGHVAVFPAASETFSRRNLNQSVDEALRNAAEVCAEARRHGMSVRGYVSTAFGCPYEGAVPLAAVVRVAEALLAAGVEEVALSDTVGVAHPGQVRMLLDSVRSALPLPAIALHFHDTRGTALANVLAALDRGVTTFDACVGGLGGCPFAPGASGNLATEDLVYLLHGLGLARGIDLPGLVKVSTQMEPVLGHPMPSRYVQAARAPSR